VGLTLHSLRERALLVAPIRVVLGLVWLVAARLVGAGGAASLLAFLGGGFAVCFAAFNDPRARFLRRREPEPAPADAVVAGRLRQALQATLPSTVGVSVLAAIALVPQPVLSAFLGGISAGLGLAGILAAVRTDPSLYLDVRRGVLYRR
jgi:hypothetical protein